MEKRMYSFYYPTMYTITEYLILKIFSALLSKCILKFYSFIFWPMQNWHKYLRLIWSFHEKQKRSFESILCGTNK